MSPCKATLCCWCRASPEVAPYPFTTVTPNLGVTHVGDFEDFESPSRLTLADLPGLIEGAHQVDSAYTNEMKKVLDCWQLESGIW